MYTPTEINNTMNAAIAARRSGNFPLAIQEAEIVLGMFSALADQEQGGFAGAKLTWDRNAVNDFINQIRRSQRASTSAGVGGLQIAKLRFVSHENTEL